MAPSAANVDHECGLAPHRAVWDGRVLWFYFRVGRLGSREATMAAKQLALSKCFITGAAADLDRVALLTEVLADGAKLGLTSRYRWPAPRWMAEEFCERLTGARAGANATSRAWCAVISPQLT
jgi:hypothetical protein